MARAKSARKKRAGEKRASPRRARRARVTLVMANLNGLDMLAQALPSLVKNTDLRQVEVFVSDGGSTDGSKAFLRKKFPWVRWLDNTLKGYGAAINYGFRKGSGDYLVMLNNDLFFLPGWLDRLLEVADSDARVGAVGARMVGKEERPERYDTLPATEDKMAVCGACILIPRRVWERVGELDYDNFKPIYGEETDWCYRALGYGYRVVLANQSRVIHLGSTTQNSILGRKRNTYLNYTNTYRALLANLSLAGLLRALPGQGLVFLRSFGQGTAASHLRALGANIRNWGYVSALRQKRFEAVRRGVPLACENAAPE